MPSSVQNTWVSAASFAAHPRQLPEIETDTAMHDTLSNNGYDNDDGDACESEPVDAAAHAAISMPPCAHKAPDEPEHQPSSEMLPIDFTELVGEAGKSDERDGDQCRGMQLASPPSHDTAPHRPSLHHQVRGSTRPIDFTNSPEWHSAEAP